MLIDQWNNEYLKIVAKLNLSIKEDIKSTRQLESFLNEKLPYEANFILEKVEYVLKHPILVVGAGPSLDIDLELCVQHSIINDLKIIAIDGSCSLFQQHQIIPDIVISDLDGEWSAIRWAISRGAIALIHAHGDNRTIIQDFFEETHLLDKKPLIWGTTQNKLKTNLFNFGGFTDGDRGIFLAIHFQSPIIGLIGFDFGEKIGKYSKNSSQILKNTSRKRVKLKIAQSLISSYYQLHNGIRFNLTDSGEEISGFPKLGQKEFKNALVDWKKRHDRGGFPTDQP